MFPRSFFDNNTAHDRSGLFIKRLSALAVVMAVCLFGGRLGAQSFYTLRPDDSKAVDFSKDAFSAHADGVADDSDALQQAINRAQETRSGVVLVPEGRYRLGKTVYLWQGLRLIGYGAKRPVLILGPNTPGFQEGSNHYMIQISDGRGQGGGAPSDGSEFTFYTAINNVDIEMGDGNPAAIAIRFHVAQHSFLSHMDIQVGSARAALEDIGNQAFDLHIHGGEYGIITKRTAPVWQFLMMDSSFDGQRQAAINTMEAGFTLVRVNFTNMPVALKIPEGEVEQLYGRDLRMVNIRNAAFVAGDWRNGHSAVTLSNIACSDVPKFYAGDESIAAPSKHYVVDQFALGLEISPDGREAGIQLRHHERPLTQPAPVVPSDIPALPTMDKWVNVRTLGVTGSNDDTAALQAAIDAHPVLFFPSGAYRVNAPLFLKPNTVMIGLNPNTTSITLSAGSEAFSGEGENSGRHQRLERRQQYYCLDERGSVGPQSARSPQFFGLLERIHCWTTSLLPELGVALAEELEVASA